MASEIICIIDRSGSMRSMSQEAIGGFNQFLKDQKAIPDDSCKFTLILFDHEYSTVYNAVDIQDVSELNDQTYIPRGTTALFDAMGRALDDAIDRIQREYTEKPRVAVMIMTDGQENASKDYKKDRLEKLVEELKSDGWQFVFMSSDLNSFNADLNTMAVGTMSLGYDSSAKGYTAAYYAASNSINAYRTGGVVAKGAVLLADDGSKKKLKIKDKDVVDAKNK